MLSWSSRVEKISLDLAIYKFNLDLFKDETSSYCSSQGVTFLGQSIIQSYLLTKINSQGKLLHANTKNSSHTSSNCHAWNKQPSWNLKIHLLIFMYINH